MNYWFNTVTIHCDADDIIGQIPTDLLEKELKGRKELEISSPDIFEKNEIYRTNELDIDIDPNDYDLTRNEDIDISDFTFEQIISYLEHNGYSVFERGFSYRHDADCFTDFIRDVPSWRFKDIICDILDLNHIATKNQIIDELNRKLK